MSLPERKETACELLVAAMTTVNWQETFDLVSKFWDLAIEVRTEREADLERRLAQLESYTLPYCSFCGATDCDH